jgi:hypothetical protein
LATVELEIAIVKADERRKPATGVEASGLRFRLSSRLAWCGTTRIRLRFRLRRGWSQIHAVLSVA